MIDFEQWLADLQTIITAAIGPASGATYIFNNIIIDPMDRDLLLDNMPLLTFEIDEFRQEVDSLPNSYLVEIDIKFVIYTFDFTSKRAAATKRNHLLKALQDVLRKTTNVQFSTGVDGSRLTGITLFGRGTDPKTEGHIATAQTKLMATGYVGQI